MADPRSRPGRSRPIQRRPRAAATPARLARRALVTAFDALERRGLMSIAPTSPLALTVAEARGGGAAVLALSQPIAPVASGARVISIRPVPPPGGFGPSPLALILPPRLGGGDEGSPLRSGVASIAPVASTNAATTTNPSIWVAPAGATARPTIATLPPSSPLPLPKVTMAEAEYAQDGAIVREFAFADHATDQITVRNGDANSEVIGTHDDGVRSPDDIKLADLNGDSIKDLVVANSGGNNVLIFPGLAGGRFAPESNAGMGVAVGAGPAAISIGDVNGDGIPDMVVANRDSNDVSLLLGRGQPADWSFQDGGRLRAGIAPVASLIDDVDHDGVADILICNSGSNTVTVLRGLGAGRFDDETPRVLAVGDGPVQMFLGRFDLRQGPELLTVNARSNDLTLISDFLGDQPSTQTIASGGLEPTSAFAADLDSNGFMDLVVANTGDGHLALFQGGVSGLALTSLVTASTLPAPTAILAGDQTSDGFDVFAVSAGQDAASILHFDLGLDAEPGGFAPIVPTLTKGSKADEDDTTAQLISHGESPFNLVGILGFASSRGDEEDDRGLDDPDVGPGRIARSRAGGQSLDDEETLDAKPEPAELPTSPGLPGADDPAAWARFVLGLDEALGEARAVAGRVIASAAFADDEPGPGQPLDDLAVLELSTPRDDRDPDAAVDAAIRAIWTEDSAGPGGDRPGGPDAGTSDAGAGRVESIPTVSLGMILAHQVLVRVSPPRRPRVRKPAARPKVGGALRAGTGRQ